MEKQNNHIDRRGFLKIGASVPLQRQQLFMAAAPELKAARDGMPPLLFRQTR